MVSAKDNELTYLWRRGGVCRECHSLRNSGCRHQQCKKIDILKSIIALITINGTNKDGKMSTGVAPHKSKAHVIDFHL